MTRPSIIKHLFAGLQQRASGKLLTILWFIIVMVSAMANIYLADDHAETIAIEQARTMFNQIVLTRNWNALHGGVYVPITKSTQPNIYLKSNERDVVTRQGTKLTMINPAFMTRQLSELATEAKGVQFHITSLNPIRPENAPAKWENAALESFEQGCKEIAEFLYKEGLHRYMAPLYTTKGCLKCHIDQGYKLGDIRGGISITHHVREILTNRGDMIIMTILVHLTVLIMSCLAIGLYLKNKQRLKQLSMSKDAAEEANNFKREFIANISHELRTPLNAIVGMSHVLINEKLEPSQLSYAKKINRAGKQLDTMINHMLDFSQHYAGDLKLNVEPLKLKNLVHSSIDLMKDKAGKKRLSLDAEFKEDLPEWLLGDTKHIQQVLFHIIDNAIKFTEKGSVKVTVSGHLADENTYSISIQVKDSGIGMKNLPEWVEQHDFSQAESSSTRTQGGVGLGLTMTRRLLALMDGDIQIKSEEGKGTTVSITLKLKKVDLEEYKNEIGAGEVKESRLALEEDHDIDTTDASPRTLSSEERQQLLAQLTELLGTLDNDISRAMEVMEEIVNQYQGSDLQDEIELLSEMMEVFDMDSAAALCRSIQEQLSNTD
ncbi:ATP-binding protein [Thermodesulfobacteriota bacterium]